jgi:hypothetical protein
MVDPASHDDDPDVVLRAVATELAEAIDAVLPAWVVRSVADIHCAWSGEVPGPIVVAAEEAGRRCAAAVGAELRSLLAAPPDEQRLNPLAVLRGAVRFPSEVLRAAGVPPVVRDAYDEHHFPDDDYGLTPRSFGDLDPSLHDLGLVWGAARARAHLVRHGAPRGTGEG